MHINRRANQKHMITVVAKSTSILPSRHLLWSDNRFIAVSCLVVYLVSAFFAWHGKRGLELRSPNLLYMMRFGYTGTRIG